MFYVNFVYGLLYISSICLSRVCHSSNEIEIERQRDRQRERERKKERKKERQRERDRERKKKERENIVDLIQANIVTVNMFECPTHPFKVIC